MGIDDIPEDREQSFPCHKCKHGSITQNIITGSWECDNCYFTQCDSDDESIVTPHDPIKTYKQD